MHASHPELSLLPLAEGPARERNWHANTAWSCRSPKRLLAADDAIPTAAGSFKQEDVARSNRHSALGAERDVLTTGSNQHV